MPATDRAVPDGGARAGSGRDGAVAQVLAPAVAAAGLVLEGVSTTAAGRRSVVRVVVDLPDDAVGELDLDRVADVSRRVAEVLDAPEGDEVLGSAPYVLEVTSPGVDRPLTQRRHWSRARGRLVSVQPVAAAGGPSRVPTTGRVQRVGDDGVLLGEELLGWAELEGAAGRVQVEFSRPDQPADDADADTDVDADDSDVDDSDVDDTDTDEED